MIFCFYNTVFLQIRILQEEGEWQLLFVEKDKVACTVHAGPSARTSGASSPHDNGTLRHRLGLKHRATTAEVDEITQLGMLSLCTDITSPLFPKA